MRDSVSGPHANRTLSALPARERDRLERALRPLPLKKGQVLFEQGRRVEQIILPDPGVAVVLERLIEKNRRMAVALLGSEGLIGAPLALKDHVAPYRAVVDIGGQGWRVDAELFRREAGRSPELGELLARYVRYLLFQIAQIALCNRYHRLDQHLCSWILKLRDLAGRAEIEMTQESLAQRLGVRRVGVTQAARKLQTAGLIRYRWGKMIVIDPEVLKGLACSCYGFVTDARESLFDDRP